MPLWEDDDGSTHDEPQSITHRVRAGHALPIISHNALFDLVLFGFDTFKGYYAKQIDYPYPTLPGIGRLANYDRYTNRRSDVGCQAFYLECLKNHVYREAKAAGVDQDTLDAAAYQVDNVGVSAFARLLGYPRFDQADTLPLQVLANLPFKIYLTISITTFLEDALRRAGKDPLTRMCRWRGPTTGPHSELWQIPEDYKLSDKQPLVYHLAGLDAHPQSGTPLPDSVALTEDNHLELLVNLAQDRGNDKVDRLPAVVAGALFDDIVLLGFRLDSWAFRGLYYGLIHPTGRERDRRGLCVVQLSPDERERQEKYLQGYLDREAHFDIFWGGLHDFARSLSG